MVAFHEMGTISKSEDISDKVAESKYWASYNAAYFKEVFDASGQPALVRMYGNVYSYENCPRAKMIKRDHANLTDMDSIMSYMRYNNYKNDPLSLCNCTPPYNPVYAIAARYDLLSPDGEYIEPNMYRRAVGGIDVKL
ncbi:putative phospholipase B-like 2 [Rhipicephalus sanguineus]|uniref:putative phospholipase B-like 2 n=1 Tax=Rhipicephalus sanguineus TaxID=34632 RepID=UPI0020C4CB0A|nr:putative phospholipase B-like 2 [Rhipicephalus sanguineus]